MGDRVAGLIRSGRLNQCNISVAQLRRIAGPGCPELFRQLDRGRAIALREAHLDQYLYSYGKMVAAQWEVVSDAVRECVQSFSFGASTCAAHMYDYGAGQGLSTLEMLNILSDLSHTGDTTWEVAHILQQDPSAVALQRAAAVAQCVAPQAQVHSQCAYLSDATHLLREEGVLHVHVFSNSIDVPGFEYAHMLNAALGSAGVHLFAVVSNDRDLCGGTARIRESHHFINTLGRQGGNVVHWDSGVQQFTCNGSMRAVSFVSLVEVS